MIRLTTFWKIVIIVVMFMIYGIANAQVGGSVLLGIIGSSNNSAANPELMTSLNAASIDNETNATTDVVPGNAVTPSVESSDTFHGSYAVKVSSNNSAGGNYARYYLAMENGKSYTVKFAYKPPSGGNGRLRIVDNLVTEINNTSPTDAWDEYEYTITANATADCQIRFYSSNSSNAGGEFCLVDKLSIKEN